MEYQLLGEIQRLRKELSDAIGSLETEGEGRGSFHDELQETRRGLRELCEMLAVSLTKKKECGCSCCTEGAHVYAGLEVSSLLVCLMHP